MSQVCLRSFLIGVLLSVFIETASAQTAPRSEDWNLEGSWNMIVGNSGVVYDASLDDHGPQPRGDIYPGKPIKQSRGEEVTVWRLKE